MKSITSVLGAAALALGFATAPIAVTPAAAFEIPEGGLTVGVSPTISSDYLFRGVSQTRNRPAVQGTLDVEHSTGLYVGAFASNVAFLGTNARQEVDYLAGYRFTVADLKLDLGGVYYSYPGSRTALNLEWFEVAGRASYEFAPFKVLGSAFYSPNFQAESGNSVYVEGGLEYTQPLAGLDFTLAGRVGYQWIDRNPRFGAPDYLNWNVTVSTKVYDFVLTVGYFDTNLSRTECFGGQTICAARAMVTLSRTF